MPIDTDYSEFPEYTEEVLGAIFMMNDKGDEDRVVTRGHIVNTLSHIDLSYDQVRVRCEKLVDEGLIRFKHHEENNQIKKNYEIWDHAMDEAAAIWEMSKHLERVPREPDQRDLIETYRLISSLVRDDEFSKIDGSIDGIHDRLLAIEEKLNIHDSMFDVHVFGNHDAEKHMEQYWEDIDPPEGPDPYAEYYEDEDNDEDN